MRRYARRWRTFRRLGDEVADNFDRYRVWAAVRPSTKAGSKPAASSRSSPVTDVVDLDLELCAQASYTHGKVSWEVKRELRILGPDP